MLKRHLGIAAGILFPAFGLPAACHAAFTFLGPTPYLSAADSPFPIGSNSTFHLEDFEDDPGCVPGPGSLCGGGKLDAPGVRSIYGSTGHGISVDADDGMIDGSGADGASATAAPVFFTPLSTFVAFQIEFDADVLGYYPTAVGIVLTDGAGFLSGLTVHDADGNVMNYGTGDIDLDPHATSDDRFVGVLNPDGISMLMFGKTILDATPTNTPRIDHLQFGVLVPEPSSICLVYMMLGALGFALVLSVRQRPYQSKKGSMRYVLEQATTAKSNKRTQDIGCSGDTRVARLLHAGHGLARRSLATRRMAAVPAAPYQYSIRFGNWLGRFN